MRLLADLKSDLKINANRLMIAIENLGKIGLNSDGGLDRITFNTHDLAARKWLINELDKIKVSSYVDQAANIWGKIKGEDDSLPSIVIGSHIDTVPNGGKFDGALGVLIALEILKVLVENQISTKHSIKLVSFTAEEQNPFNLSTFGSRVVTSKLNRKDIQHIQDAEGTLLSDALKIAGGCLEKIEEARRDENDIAAFLEVHIEQGKRLINKEIPVGIVSSITGIYREEITIYGEANHAGTTLMRDRKDALVAASELVLAVEKVTRERKSNEIVGTIGKFNVFPDAPNIIPCKVNFLMEIRGNTKYKVQSIVSILESYINSIQHKYNVSVSRKVILNQDPTGMNPTIIEILKRQAEDKGYKYSLLGSMEDHDATHMASITKTGMLFVPSIDGKSHCPEEKSKIEDIEKVANVLLQAILELDIKIS
jgi:beta-ureidopropionase / N-carbamoyl-L-amino-acid hydrolase